MVSRQSRVGGQRGLTLVELMVVIAVIGIISIVATPLFMTFLRAMETRGASQELAALLHQARELAIATNSYYRVEIDPNNNQLRFAQSTDGGDTYSSRPSPTDGQDYWRPVNQARLTCATANPTFNPLGSAVVVGTITVQNASGTSSLNVVVSQLGRIRQCGPTVAGCTQCP